MLGMVFMECFMEILSFGGNMDLKSIFAGIAIPLALGLLLIGYLYTNALGEIAELKKDLQLSKANVVALQESITKQNLAIKALEIKASKPPKEIEIIKEIKLKDSSCESELRGYKKLFKEMGR